MDGHRIQQYWSNEMEAMLETYKQFEILIPAKGRKGAAHCGEDGRYVETLIREYLKRYLPKDLEVLTGFIMRPAVKTGCNNDEHEAIRGPFLALVAMESFEKKELSTDKWIFEKMSKIYTEEEYFDDLIGYIGSLNKWSIFKKRPQKGHNAEYLYFNHNEEEMHLGFQFMLTGILSVYYDKSRNNISRPGFTAFPSKRECNRKLGNIVVRDLR